MTTYTVKRSLLGIIMEQLDVAKKAVNEKSAIPFDEITEVLDLVP